MIVQGHGTRLHLKNFIVFIYPNTKIQIGITVTKKIGNAPTRNRIKRLVREVCRKNLDQLGPQSIVWVAKKSAATATYQDVLKDFERI